MPPLLTSKKSKFRPSTRLRASQELIIPHLEPSHAHPNDTTTKGIEFLRKNRPACLQKNNSFKTTNINEKVDMRERQRLITNSSQEYEYVKDEVVRSKRSNREDTRGKSNPNDTQYTNMPLSNQPDRPFADQHLQSGKHPHPTFDPTNVSNQNLHHSNSKTPSNDPHGWDMWNKPTSQDQANQISSRKIFSNSRIRTENLFSKDLDEVDGLMEDSKRYKKSSYVFESKQTRGSIMPEDIQQNPNDLQSRAYKSRQFPISSGRENIHRQEGIAGERATGTRKWGTENSQEIRGFREEIRMEEGLGDEDNIYEARSKRASKSSRRGSEREYGVKRGSQASQGSFQNYRPYSQKGGSQKHVVGERPRSSFETKFGSNLIFKYVRVMYSQILCYC